MQFITSIRITNAQMLLETTNYAVNEIAHIVGYDNPLYFSRLFHKQKGCSPSEYRKLLKWTNKRGSLSEWFSLESLLILSCYLRHSLSQSQMPRCCFCNDRCPGGCRIVFMNRFQSCMMTSHHTFYDSCHKNNQKKCYPYSGIFNCYFLSIYFIAFLANLFLVFYNIL